MGRILLVNTNEFLLQPFRPNADENHSETKSLQSWREFTWPQEKVQHMATKFFSRKPEETTVENNWTWFRDNLRNIVNAS